MTKRKKPGGASSAPSGLSARAKRFVDEYVIDLNATQAALRAGYSPATAKQQGSRLLTNVDVKAAIDAKLQARSFDTGVSATNVLAEFARLAFSDIGQVVDFSADMIKTKDPRTIPEAARRAIQSVKVKRTTTGKGDDISEVVETEFKLWPKTAALDALAKHLRLFHDPSEAVLALLAALPHDIAREVSERLTGHDASGSASQGANDNPRQPESVQPREDQG